MKQSTIIENLQDSMMIEVMDFISSIMKDINPKAKKALGEDDWLINALNVEGRVYKLLVKAYKLGKDEAVLKVSK